MRSASLWSVLLSVVLSMSAFGEINIAILKTSSSNRAAETVSAIDSILDADSTIDLIVGPAENLGGDSNKARIIFGEDDFAPADTFARSYDVYAALEAFAVLAEMHGTTIIPGTIWEVDSNLRCFEAVPIFGPDGEIERVRRKAHQNLTDPAIDSGIRLDTIHTRDGSPYTYLITISNEATDIPNVYGSSPVAADIWLALDRRWGGSLGTAITIVADGCPPNWSFVYAYSDSNQFAALVDSNWITPQTPLVYCDYDSDAGATIVGNLFERYHSADEWFVIPNYREYPNAVLLTLSPENPQPNLRIDVVATDTSGHPIEDLFVNYGPAGSVPVLAGWTDETGLYQTFFTEEESVYFLFSMDTMLVSPEETTIYIAYDAPRCTLAVAITPDSTTSISATSLPENVRLSVEPNPFNSTCRITAKGDITIRDMTGRMVRKFAMPEGNSILWDGSDNSGKALSSGIYFIEASGTSGRKRIKIILLR